MEVVIDEQYRVDGVLPEFPDQAHIVSAEVKRERAWVGQDPLLFQFGAELGVPEIMEAGHAVGAGKHCAVRLRVSCLLGVCILGSIRCL